MQARHVVSSESQPLLSPHRAMSINSRKTSVESDTSICTKHLLSRLTCKLTNAAIIITLINIFMSVCYAIIVNITVIGGSLHNDMGHIALTMYSLTAVVSLFYPVSGFIADVYCGRYRVIFIGICLMFVACTALAVDSMLTVMTTIREGRTWYSTSSFTAQLISTYLAIIFIAAFIIGFAGYQANFIQFGLDQLLESPSKSLVLFIHWVIWAKYLGQLFIQILSAVFLCELKSYIANSDFGASLTGYTSMIMVVLNFLIILSMKYFNFYAEPRRQNPYKVVFKVLDYARKHKYPFRRSAFTYCDDEFPSRIDFAKEKFGGPFTTEQVEDVKTFLRILLVFVVLGPVFVLDVPTSNFVSFLFGIHAIGKQSYTLSHSCSSRFILLASGSLMSLISTLFLPLYMWIVFSGLSRYTPRIFSRLIIAVVLYLLGVVSMFCIDLVGHHITNKNGTPDASMCMFLHISHPYLLGLNWAVMLLPGILTGIGQPLVMATSFEFISAQSPSSMKGLLVGVFFSIKAFFQLVSGLVLIPFSSDSLWDSEYMREHPPVTNCGFGYLLFTCVVALIGLILLSVVARRYKYRERDDRPFDHRFAIAVIGRDIEERSSLEYST